MNKSFWKDKNVLVTGHTGFKGSWLVIWLKLMGAKVHGYALTPPTNPNLFELADVKKDLVSHVIADIADFEEILKLIQQVKPQIIFHMAAQSLVRHSYAMPLETYSVNVMGTVNLLEAVRQSLSARVVVNITSDKCYHNHERLAPYKEGEALGGHDPYSSSKACSELVTEGYIQSFFKEFKIGVATARAGNVIGGGDWSADRLIPDFFRAESEDRTLMIRSPNAIRPWQHVLEPLSGYLSLAEKLYEDPIKYSGPWNFGPSEESIKNVSWILDKLAEIMPNAKWGLDDNKKLHEADLLSLDSNKAKEFLSWNPRWTLNQAINNTVIWHNAYKAGADLKKITRQQINDYMEICT